jgi:MFS family permease
MRRAASLSSRRWLTAQVPTYLAWIAAALLQGIGIVMVYPTLLAAISDVANLDWRATTMGVYRFWSDLGYAIGGMISGITADLLGMRSTPGAWAHRRKWAP